MSLSSLIVFKIDRPIKRLSHFLEKVVLLARSLGQEGNRIFRSFGWEENKNTRRCKGIKCDKSYICCVVKYVYDDLHSYDTLSQSPCLPD